MCCTSLSYLRRALQIVLPTVMPTIFNCCLTEHEIIFYFAIYKSIDTTSSSIFFSSLLYSKSFVTNSTVITYNYHNGREICELHFVTFREMWRARLINLSVMSMAMSYCSSSVYGMYNRHSRLTNFTSLNRGVRHF